MFYGENLNLANLVPSHALAQILIVCFVFGGFGGWVAHCINNERQHFLLRAAAAQQSAGTGSASPQEPWFLFPSAWQSAAIGAAGAIAFLFFVIAVGGLTNFQTLTEQLRSIAVSVIAGFGARRLLPRMVGHLEKQMETVKLEAERASHDAKQALDKQREAEKELENTRQRLRETETKMLSIELNERLNAAVKDGASAEHAMEALRQFVDARAKGLARASVWINAARVQRRYGSLDEAIKTLDEFIAAVKGEKVNKDANYPAAYFNRACYYWLRFKKNKNPSDKAQALQEIAQFLDHSENPPVGIAEIRQDEDLKDFAELYEFRAIASKYEAPGGG